MGSFENPLATSLSRDEEDMDEIQFDQIEVDDDDAVDGVGVANADEAITNATDFLVECNENYELSWIDAAQQVSEVTEDPSKPPRPGWNEDYLRFRLRRVVESFLFRVFTLLLILIDLVIVLVDLFIGGSDALRVADLAITVYFVIEIVLRIAALTQRVFFTAWYNVIDFAVVLSTFVLATAAQASPVAWGGRGTTGSAAFLTALRLVRVVRFVRLYTEKQQVAAAARQLISQNKRRYQQDGHDLDLTYVTRRVIATSFPSSGLTALYRNPIEKVAAFLDQRHPGKYRLYNLCSERAYDTSYFHNRVERIYIDDHNVPTLQQMSDFARSVRSWLSQDPGHVVVVHCKGGKGRTGTMICVWLVESGVFSTAGGSLQYFGQRRTDTNVGKKFQGVETPSQSRYVEYYERMKSEFSGRPPPTQRMLLFSQIEITGLATVGVGDGSDLWFELSQGHDRSRVFSAHLGFRRNCAAVYDPDRDVLTAQVVNCPALEGDVRVLFRTNSRIVPRGYENCPLYFWFNTSFVDPSGILELKREQLDNPHKPKTWHCFTETFKVTLKFEKTSENRNGSVATLNN